MKSKRIIVSLMAFALLLVFSSTAFGYYSAVTGELRDSKTNGLYAPGGTVTVYDNVGMIIAGPTAVGSTFNVPLPPMAPFLLVVEVTFNPGPNQVNPVVTESKIVSNSPGATGAVNVGSFYSNTGPTAVSLQDFGTTANNLPLLGIGLVILALIGITFVTIRRRQTA